MSAPNRTELTAAQRKKLLIAQGKMYRLGITESQGVLRANLQPGVLAKSALNGLVTSASAAFGHGFSLRNFSDANLQTILPLLVSAGSLLAKRRSLIKPLLIGAIALAATSAVARVMLRKKTARQR